MVKMTEQTYPTQEEYIELAEKSADLVEELSREKLTRFRHHDFDLNSDETEVKIFSGRALEFPELKQSMLKANTLLHAPIEKVFEHVAPFLNKRREWDREIESQQVLEKLPGEVYVVYTLYRHRGSLPSRDSVIAYKVRRLENEIIVAGTSTTHPKAPKTRFQRALYNLVAYRMKAASNDEYTKLRVIWCNDLDLPTYAPVNFKHTLLADMVQSLVHAGVPSINPRTLN